MDVLGVDGNSCVEVPINFVVDNSFEASCVR